ncbi:hypothetical protein RND81_07G146500 [Saponaria officinalis]|uniref:Uncharacterized protein n=1 Tax=Saponaria officinalis TaxID=3572 RepID=A0AAW1JQZ8_SAPOF
MGYISQNAFLLTILFIVTGFTTNNAEVDNHVPSHAPAPSPSHHHHHHHSPALGPSPSPSDELAPTPSMPSKPVTPAPTPAPSHGGKRQYVAVQGIVYCKNNCSNIADFNNTTLSGDASPRPGAKVVLRCRNTKYLLRNTAITDKNGYFFIEAPPVVTTYGAHKCKVYLSHKPKPNGPCSNPTDLNNGLSGAFLYSNNTGPPKALSKFSLFSVGPFAYESATCEEH